MRSRNAAGGSDDRGEDGGDSRDDRGCRLVKGQVFLREGAGDWEELWDVDGTDVTWKRVS